MTSQRRPAADERPTDGGSVAVEMVVLTPVLVLLILLIVLLGRAGGSVQQVRHAADAGARAASLVDRGSMEQSARSTAVQDLSDNGVNCSSSAITVVIAGAPQPTSVTVTVSCVVNTRGTSLVGSVGRTVTATSTEAVDRHRGS